MKSHHLIVLTIAAITALALGFWAGGLNKQETSPHSTESTGRLPAKLPEFSLADFKQQPFDNARLRGQWSMMFFGYMNCPDVCPTTLYNLRLVMNEYEKLGGNTRDWLVVFVSVDPERDTPENLEPYVHYFHPEFIGVTGDPKQIARLASSIGISYQRVANPQRPENYLVDHSAAVTIIAPDGTPHSAFNPHQDAGKIASELLQLTQVNN
jgi:protein SCO1/2